MKNFFSLFEIPVSFKVDFNQLEKNFLFLQKKYNPDNFPSINAEEKIKFIKFVEQINIAFETLSDFVKRGEYLLNMNNYSIQNKSQYTQITLSQKKLSDIFSQTEEKNIKFINNAIHLLKNKIITAFDKKNYQQAAEFLLEYIYLQKVVK